MFKQTKKDIWRSGQGPGQNDTKIFQISWSVVLIEENLLRYTVIWQLIWSHFRIYTVHYTNSSCSYRKLRPTCLGLRDGRRQRVANDMACEFNNGFIKKACRTNSVDAMQKASATIGFQVKASARFSNSCKGTSKEMYRFLTYRTRYWYSSFILLNKLSSARSETKTSANCLTGKSPILWSSTSNKIFIQIRPGFWEKISGFLTKRAGIGNFMLNIKKFKL